MSALDAPFPYVGGKSQAARYVWTALGDPDNYVEPFFGSGAVLLRRPHRPRFEIVNDADGLIANAWRAMRAAPDEVAAHVDWPINEVDQHARELWLVGQRESLTSRLIGDPEYYDARAAGWWIWGASVAMFRWCAGDGCWGHDADGRFARLPRVRGARDSAARPLGVSLQRPMIASGEGVHRSGYASSDGSRVRAWFDALSQRLRHVRVCCGDWTRVVTRSTTVRHPLCIGGGWCGVFLDPPYGAADQPRQDLYACDSSTVAADVRAWCIEHGGDERLRIVLAGWAGEGHEDLETHGWRVIDWRRPRKAFGQGRGHQQYRERLWVSPRCLEAEQLELRMSRTTEAL